MTLRRSLNPRHRRLAADRGVTRRWRWAGLLAACLLVVGWLTALGPAVATAQAQIVPPPRESVVPGPTEPPPEPTPPPALPTEPPALPTEPPLPPTAAPVAPTPLPPRERDDDDDEPPAPPPQVSATEGSAPTASRTRRPTRTPRTTPTLTPTPFVAGALRLTLRAEPPLPSVGAPLTLEVQLDNRGAEAAINLTLETTLPEAVLVDRVDPGPGARHARSGQSVRWLVTSLRPGERATLRMHGVLARAATDGLRWCALLLSSGAPLEHCVLLGSATGTPPPRPSPTPDAAAGPTPRAPLAELASGRTAGWLLVALGLAALGLWVGVGVRGREAGGS